MSTKGTEIKCGPRESRERSSSCLQKRAKKSTLRESTVMRAMKKDPTFKKVMETQKDTRQQRGVALDSTCMVEAMF